MGSQKCLGVVAILSFATLSFAPLAKADNLVQNPDFYAPSSGYGQIAGWTQGPFPSTLNGYPYLTGSDIYQSATFWNNGLAGRATTVGYIQVYSGNPSTEPTDELYQTLNNLIVGDTYTFSDLENGRRGYQTPVVEALIDGNVLVAPHSDTPLDPGGGQADSFYVETGSFTATATQEELAFVVSQANPDDDATALITDVSVTQGAATPEPSGLVLLGTGLMGAVGFTRRKSRKT